MILDVVLETFERAELARVDDDTVADDADRGVALELAFADDTAGHGADLRYLEDVFFWL